MSWPKVKSGWAPIGGVVDLIDEEERIDLTSSSGNVEQRLERVLDELLEQAAQMDAECHDDRCGHAQGVRLAVEQVRTALADARG